ncbi:unnamed protein product [Amaranthus hypochondriacus]
MTDEDEASMAMEFDKVDFLPDCLNLTNDSQFATAGDNPTFNAFPSFNKLLSFFNPKISSGIRSISRDQARIAHYNSKTRLE